MDKKKKIWLITGIIILVICVPLLIVYLSYPEIHTDFIGKSKTEVYEIIGKSDEFEIMPVHTMDYEEYHYWNYMPYCTLTLVFKRMGSNAVVTSQDKF